MTAEETSVRPDVDDAETDPNDRVHHHARLGDRRGLAHGPVLTLCGLRLSGPRPEAASLPCCPMCAEQLDAMGKRCR